MKKIFLLPILLASFVSCQDLLESESHTSVGSNNYVNNASQAEVLLNGCYSDLGSSDALYAYYLSLAFTLSTDIAQCEGDGNTSYRVIPTNSHTSSDSSVQDVWEALYSGIYNTNSLMELTQARMDNWSAEDQALAAVIIGEAKALRALYYFELVRWFGNVSIMSSTAQSLQPLRDYLQNSPVEVYEFIETDLRDAIEVLPWATEDNVRKDNSYRFSKGAAYGLLAKVYATWAGYPLNNRSKWELAADAAGALVNSSRHSLNPNYESVWYNTANNIWEPNESLIEVSFYTPTGIDNNEHMSRVGKWNGVATESIDGVRGRNAANVKVNGIFSLNWETKFPDDKRYALSVADYFYGYKIDGVTYDGAISYADHYLATATNPSESKIEEKAKDNRNKKYNPAKWDEQKYVESGNRLVNQNYSNINWYVLRYSDVLLLYAEALVESGGSIDAAVAAVNSVRERGYGANYNEADDGILAIAATLSGSDIVVPKKDPSYEVSPLLQAIRNERAYELCFEGHRKQDLIRWGIYNQTIFTTHVNLLNWYELAVYPVARYTIEGKHELMPIPQRDKDLMPNYVQNPQW